MRRFDDGEGPSLLRRQRAQFGFGDRIVGANGDGGGRSHRPRCAQRWPGAFHAARVDRKGFAHLPNGFFALRKVSRTGTAPKPSSLRMPFTR